jgi:2Fe-2S ferredoxin
MEKLNMPMVHWILPDGSRLSDDVSEGTNLMDAAQFKGVAGIDGECGGNLSCATCHVVVDDPWATLCPSVSDTESAMLEVVTSPRQPHSRLSCQLHASLALDGIVLRVPSA